MQPITFLHCADVHIGAAESFLGTAAAKRRTETLMTFERILALAKAQSVDLVLIAGDLFDSNRIDPELIDRAFSAIASAAPIPVAVAAGNHDPLSADSPYLSKNRPENLLVLGGENCCISPETLPVRLYGRSFTGVYMRGEERFPLTPPQEDQYHIMLLHGDTSGDLQSDYNGITSGFIAHSGMDYIALGHIHRRSLPARLGKTVFAYPGCPEGQGFDEDGEKGVYLGTLDGTGCRLEFVPTGLRRHETVPVDVSEIGEASELFPLILKTLRARFGEHYGQNLYKIVLEGAAEETLKINADELASRLSGEVYFAKVRDNTTVRADYEALAAQPDLKGIFVRRMLEKIAGAPQDEQQTLRDALDIGLRAFHSEVKYREDH